MVHLEKTIVQLKTYVKTSDSVLETLLFCNSFTFSPNFVAFCFSKIKALFFAIISSCLFISANRSALLVFRDIVNILMYPSKGPEFAAIVDYNCNISLKILNTRNSIFHVRLNNKPTTKRRNTIID